MGGRVIILSGPSGCGKDTVIEAWRVRNQRVKRVTAYTTRHPRESEIDGEDYHFVSEEEFQKKEDCGFFLEAKSVHGHRYGTPQRDLQRMVDDGLLAVLKIDVQGALDAMEKLPEALTIFLLPPDMEELERRIRSRALDDEETVQLRLRNAADEMSLANKYQHAVVNDSVERAVSKIEELVA